MTWYQLLDHSQKILGICLHLEIVGKINMYIMSDIFPYHQMMLPFAS